MNRQAAQNILLLNALTHAIAALGDDLPCLPIKGGALLAAGIVQPWARHLDDIDLWVPSALARIAWDRLTASGFTPVGPSPSTTHGGQAGLAAPTHQLPMLRSPHGALVELHLESHANGPAGNFEACFAAGTTAVVNGVTVRVPCPLHQLEHLCGHVVVHHFGDLRYWPRHMADIRALLAREPDLAAMRARADEVGLSLRVLHGVDSPASADALLAKLFISPSATMQTAWRAVSFGGRTLRFAMQGPKSLLHAVLPTSGHLRFTGDLSNETPLASAHLRRWRRIAKRRRIS